MRTDPSIAQRGQAMTEFLVACLVLIPVFLAMPLLAKYLDIGHSATQGARYLAWERTVWTPDRKGDARLENELRNRVFTRVGESIRPNDGDAAPGEYNPLWRAPGGKPMLASYDVGGSTDGGKGQMTPGAIYNTLTDDLFRFYNFVITKLEFIGGVRQAEFQVNVRGMYASTIGVNVAAQGEADTTGIVPKALHVDALTVVPRRNYIVTDAWTASGPGTGNHCTAGQDSMSELCQVAPLVLTTGLSGWFQKLTDAVGTVIPEFKGMDYGHIEPGVAPDDREPKKK